MKEVHYMKKILSLVLCLLMIAACCGLTACQEEKITIMVWGPSEHEALYRQWLAEFKELHAEELKNVIFDYAGSGDAGAYSAMATDPASGAAVYTFANDQMANLLNLGALSQVTGDNLEWSKNNNSAASVEATKMGDTYYSYPLQADNGYYMYFNKAAFKGTSVWDEANDTLKAGYTFRDLYNALDEKGGDWANGKVTYAMGDSWYLSGVFFAVGGDYSVEYDEEGKQSSADCWFAYTAEEGQSYVDGDFTVGMNAVECMINAICDKGTTNINKHYVYTDGDKNPLNDYISIHTNPDEDKAKSEPLAAVVCGTWKAKELQQNWGDDYAATVLPTLETNDGSQYAMKNFAGYKNIGVNPQCSFATKSRENLLLLHELAQYLSGKDQQIARYNATGAGPSNLEALKDETIANDAALQALNAQYDRECVYPAGTANAGKDVGNGLGYRVQDSVPANYWTPIQKFGNQLFNELDAGKLDGFSEDNIKRTLAQLQMDVEAAAQ